MSDTVQQVIVAAVILGALLYLILRARKKKSGCGDGGCGCATKKPGVGDQ